MFRVCILVWLLSAGAISEECLRHETANGTPVPQSSTQHYTFYPSHYFRIIIYYAVAADPGH